MTATPIPRTLALTACGDMDVSVIRGLPPGRQPIRTLVKPDSRRDEVYALIREEAARGRQAYVVYPLVEESEKVDLRAATAMAEEMTRVFPEYEVALLHGRMKGDEKDAVMRALRRRQPAHPGGDLGRRGRRRRAQRDADGGRTRRAVRTVAAAPAARPHRPRRPRVDLRARLPGALVRRCARAAEGDGGQHRRVRDRGEGPADSRAGRFLRHPPVGAAATACRRPHARRRPAGAGLHRGAPPRGRGPPAAAARRTTFARCGSGSSG